MGPCSRHWPPMVLTTPIKEAAHADDGYQPRLWINTVLLSHPGLASAVQISPRSFPTLEDLANPISDSSPSSDKRTLSEKERHGTDRPTPRSFRAVICRWREKLYRKDKCIVSGKISIVAPA